MPPVGFHKYLSGFPPPKPHKHEHHHIAIFILDFFAWLFEGRAFPRPHPPNFAEESQVLANLFFEFWHLVLIIMGAIIVLIVFLLGLIKLAMIYDRYQSKYGAVGTQLTKREEAMVAACEKRGRGVMERMEKERVERIFAETDRRQAIKDEHLGRKGILQGKLPVLGEETVEGVGEGPAPRRSSLPRHSVERRKSKREERRGEGTQMVSREEDILRRRQIATLSAGAEARIGNSVWRSGSGETIYRLNSQPSVFYSGSWRTLLNSMPAHSLGGSSVSDSDGYHAKGEEEAIGTKAIKTGLTYNIPQSHVPFLQRLSFESEELEILNVPAIVAPQPPAGNSQVFTSSQNSSTDSSSTTSSSESSTHIKAPIPSRAPSSIRSPILDATPYVSPDETSPPSASDQTTSSCKSSSSPSREMESLVSDRLLGEEGRRGETPYYTPYTASTQSLVTDHLLGEPLSSINTPYHTPYAASTQSLVTDHLPGEPLSPIHTAYHTPYAASMQSLHTQASAGTTTNTMGMRRSRPGSVAASVDTLHGRLRLPRLIFEVPGGWSPVSFSPLGNSEEERGDCGDVGGVREEGALNKEKENGGGGTGWWPW